jgi:predicted dehydrogenase
MTNLRKTRVGVIGCGNISKAYLTNLPRFPHVEVVACADLNPAAAEAQARAFGVPRILAPEALVADPAIDIVVNLTIPQAHVTVDLDALRHGKHVFSEKPYALTREEAQEVSALARAAGLRVGCAPDTVLGAGVQTCRRLVDEGAIGRPLAFAANMLCGGHESWHPSPEFYYLKGGGPLFDMGPYYLHALITLLGPVRSVSAAARISFPERTIASQPKAGTKVKVEVPTHLTAILEFVGGAVGTLTTSFDICGPHTNPGIEIYGEEGSLQVPDPNGFGGPVFLGRRAARTWEEVALTHPYADGGRGLGVADMAAAIARGRSHRANDAIALHAVDIMLAVHEAAAEGTRLELSTTCERPEPMRADLPPFELE